MFKQFKSIQIVFSVWAVFCGFVAAQPPSLENVYLYGGVGNQRGLAISASANDLYFSGYQYGPGQPSAARLARIDGVDGSIVWWGAPTSKSVPWSLVAAAEQVLVAGNVMPPECGAVDGYGGTEGKTLFAAYDAASGSRTSCVAHLYYPSYRGYESYYELARLTDANGESYYAAGWAEQWGFGGHRYLVASYDSMGNRLNYTVDPATFSFAQAVAANSSSVYVAGFRRHSSSHNDPELPFVVKLDSGLSAESWRQTLDSSAAGARARFFGVAVEDDAVYAVGEWRLSDGNYDYLAARLNSATGSVDWQRVFGSSGTEALTGVAVREGRVFAVGYASSASGADLDGVLFELDPNDGSVVFEEFYGGDLDDSYAKIAVDGSDLWISGWSDSFATPEGNAVGERDMMLVHYSLFSYVFGGFLPPVNQDGSSLFKSGRVIPLKFSLYLPSGEIAADAAATLALFKISDQVSGTDPEIYPEPAGQSNTGDAFRFDHECGCYIYNLSTKGLSAGTYRARVTLDDGSAEEVVFSVTF